MTHRLWLVAAFIFAFTLVCAPQSVSQADQSGTYLYTRVSPAAIYADGVDSATIEVFTTNQNVAEVSLSSYRTGETLMLFDDGSHGDRLAGDGVYTIDGITTSFLPPDMWLFQGKAGTADFDIMVNDSGGQSTGYGWGIIRVVDAGVEYPAQQVAPNMFASEYALFIADPEGQISHGEPYPLVDQELDFPTATQMFYSVYPDDFDFLVVMPIHPNYRPSYGYVEGPVPFATTVRPAASHIGMDFHADETASYGSAGRLLTVVYHSAGYGSMLTHEIGHTWGVFIGDAQGFIDQKYHTAHWDAHTDVGGTMASFVTPFQDDLDTEMDRVSQGLPVNFHIQSNPDGSFRLADAHGSKQFAPLDLYLMGLIPPEEVPPVHMLTNPDFSDLENVTSQEVKTFTIQEIMNIAGGPREPAYPDAQRDFNVGFIFFADQSFSAAEIAWGSLVAREVTLENSDSIETFYGATGGLGTLNTRLADWAIP